MTTGPDHVPGDQQAAADEAAAAPDSVPGPPPATVPTTSGTWATRWVLLGVTALAIALLPALVWLHPSPGAGSCKIAGAPRKTAATPALPKNYKPVKLILSSGQDTTLAFGRALTSKTLTLQYGVSTTIPAAAADPRLQVADPLGFSSDEQVPIPGSQVSVKAWVQNSRVLLRICVARDGAHHPDPGTYQGTVSIVDPRVDRVDVPVTLTMSYPRWEWIMELLLLAVLLGTWYSWALKAKDPDDPALGWEFVDYCGSMLGVLSIGAGVVAAFGVYTATYLNGTVWGSTVGQYFAVFGAMFSAFLAGAATVHIGAQAGRAADADAKKKADAKTKAAAGAAAG